MYSTPNSLPTYLLALCVVKRNLISGQKMYIYLKLLWVHFIDLVTFMYGVKSYFMKYYNGLVRISR